MKRLWSSRWAVATGSAVTVLVVVALMATGVLPVKTETTTVVHEKSATTAAATSTVALTSAAMTPAQIYNTYSAGVVEVLSTFATVSSTSPYGQSSSSAQALGSGFIVSTDGTILTNAHVVSNNGARATSVKVVFKTQSGSGTDTTTVAASVVGVDETSDVAVLKVDPLKAPALDPLPLGDSSAVQVGEAVVAIGNPLGYDFSVTSGIVSATNRNLQSPNGSVIPDGIQTDAAINEGNSGGPLIDASGHVIGINEQIASQSGGNQGLGFAVPINTAASVMKQLQATGKVTYAYLGVQGQTITSDIAGALGLKQTQGVLVAAVSPGSPAAKAGLKGGSQQTDLQGQPYVVGGDVITAMDGETLASMDELGAAIMKHKPGDAVTLTVVSGGKTKDVKVTLAERPSSS
ncbi:MAG TPA: trypsin-like peptidase domain-containing protein [Thermoleophilia bacterium]